MTETKPKEKAKKINVLVGARVEADMSAYLWRRNYYGKEEEFAKALESACKDFVEFLRDHRSQDLIQLEVVRDYEDRCSVCKDTWEVDYDENNKPFCACCGADLE